uniref:Uncharacterized protein n=1 Tax=Arundo donax TaxID=35708 RepID=A0A0A8YQ61_ARUDO
MPRPVLVSPFRLIQEPQALSD